MDVRRIIIIALFAALLVAGAYVTIPIGPVPITLQTAFVLLAGVLGGKKIAGPAIAIYLSLGAMGLPIFSGGIGGFAHFAGPTGGFLISWLAAAPITGYLTDRGFRIPQETKTDKVSKKQLLWMILGVVVGTLIIYGIGIPYMKFVLSISWSQALVAGFLPFLPGDLVKIVAVVLLGNLFALRVREFVKPDKGVEETADEINTGN